MLRVLAEHWWVVALRGLFAVIFGLCAIIVPGLTVTALIVLFGAYALVDGIFLLIAGIRGGAGVHRAPLIAQGILSAILGILVFSWPGLTALALLYFIAVWAIIIGAVQIVSAVQLRREIANEWFLGITGALSVLFGLICFIYPRSGALAVIWIIGIYALLFGIMLIMLAFRLRGMGEGMAGRMRGAV
jgi:uncharacterized membrane protein HdeD (DUF308 family)